MAPKEILQTERLILREMTQAGVAIREVTADVIVPLRRGVLRPGRPLEESRYPADADALTFHLAAFQGADLVGCATGLAEPAPETDASAYRLRGMAVLEPFRNQGIGYQLLEAFESRARARGVASVWCNGRSSAAAFYQRHGWAPASGVFDLIGIPHRVFTKPLTGIRAFRPFLREPVDPALPAEIATLEAKLASSRTAKHPLALLKAQGRLGDRLRAIGRLDEAVELLSHALQRAEKSGDAKLALVNRIRLGTARQYRGEHEVAQTMLRRAVQEALDLGMADHGALAYQHLGKCLAELGQREEAKSCFERALGHRLAAEDRGPVASTRRALLALEDRPLETPRLILEPLGKHHAAALWEGLGEPTIYRFIPGEPPASLADLAHRYERLTSRLSPDGSVLWLNWAARDSRTGAYVGRFEATVRQDGSADVGYILFKPYWRQGFGREGCEALVNHLFEQGGVTVVAAEMDTRNDASLKLVESLGFRRVAVTFDADYFKGATSHEYRYELRREDGPIVPSRHPE